MTRKKIGRIKSDNHSFDLWFFGELLDETVRCDNARGFCNVIDSNPDLAEEYFNQRMKEIEKVELPPDFDSEAWSRKMLDRIHRAIEEKKD